MKRTRTSARKRNPKRGLWLRGGVWWLDAAIPGYGRMRCSLDTGDEIEALQRARERRAFPERYFGKDKISVALEDYLAVRRNEHISKAWLDHCRMVLESLKPFAPNGAIESIAAREAQNWWLALVKKNAEGTAWQYLRHVKGFYKWALENGRRIGVSPFDGILAKKPVYRPRKLFLSPEDALRVLDECLDPAAPEAIQEAQKELKFCLYCALHCGFRRGEVIASRPHWFNLKKMIVHIQNESDWSTKDRDQRIIPLTDEFAKFLKDDYGLRKPYMFRPDVQPKETNLTGKYRTDFKKAFDGHMKRLGLSEYTFHDLRRTFASLHVSKGTPIYSVAKWLGDDIAIVEKTYAHLLPGDPRINDPWNEARGVDKDPGKTVVTADAAQSILAELGDGKEPITREALLAALRKLAE